ETHTLRRTAALLRPKPTRVTDEHSAHQPRRDSEEVRAVDPLHARLIDKLQVRFVNQARRAERVTAALVPELPGRVPAKLVVEQRHESVERVAIAAAPREEKTGHIDVVARGADSESGHRVEDAERVVTAQISAHEICITNAPNSVTTGQSWRLHVRICRR